MSSKLAFRIGLAISAVVALLAANSPSHSTANQGSNAITVPVEGRSLGLNAAIDLDASGYPVIAYFSGQLELLHCGSPTCSSGNTNTSLPTGSYTFDLSMLLDSGGDPVISYYDSDSQTLRILRCGDPDCSASNVTTVADAVGNVKGGDSTSLALDGAGNPVVSYHDRTTKDLKILHCGNPTCSAGNSIAVPDSAGDTGRASSLTLDPAGNPVVSYCVRTSINCGVLKVLRCGNATCTSGNVITSPDSSGDVGNSTSIVLDTAGMPIVGHLEIGGGLKVLQCGDATCTTGNMSTIVDPYADFAPSLVLGASDHPIISYGASLAAFDNQLRVLHCGNTSCSAGNSIAIVDTDDNLISSSTRALTLDSAGLPIVAYHGNGVDGELRVLHCGSADCLKVAPPPTPTATAEPPTPTPDAVGGLAVEPTSSIGARFDQRLLWLLLIPAGLGAVGAARMARTRF